MTFASLLILEAWRHVAAWLHLSMNDPQKRKNLRSFSCINLEAASISFCSAGMMLDLPKKKTRASKNLRIRSLVFITVLLVRWFRCYFFWAFLLLLMLFYNRYFGQCCAHDNNEWSGDRVDPKGWKICLTVAYLNKGLLRNAPTATENQLLKQWKTS